MERKTWDVSLNDWLLDPALQMSLKQTTDVPLSLSNMSFDPQHLQDGSFKDNISSRYTDNSCNHVEESLLARFRFSDDQDFEKLMVFTCNKFFKLWKHDILKNLRITDFIVDQTFSNSLTLRQVKDGKTRSDYKYFNTISRENDVFNCPIYAISLYFQNRWNSEIIDVNNFEEVQLLPKLFIDDTTYKEYNHTSSTKSKIFRSFVNPSSELINLIYPWISDLESNMIEHDRTNYKLYLLIELFRFLAKVWVQDMAYLQCTGIFPDLITNISSSNQSIFNSLHYQLFKEEMGKKIDEETIQFEWGSLLLHRIEEKFVNFTKEVNQDNTRISTELQTVKNDLGDLNSMVLQILQFQRQILSGSLKNTSVSTNKNPSSISNDARSLLPVNILTSTGNDSITQRKLPTLSETFSPGIPFFNENNYKKLKMDEKSLTSGHTYPSNTGSPLESLLSKPINSPKISIPTLTPNATNIDKILIKFPPSTTTLNSDIQKSPLLSTSKPPLLFHTNKCESVSNDSIKYKLSRDNKSICDLYTEWYLGLNGKPSIKSLIEKYGWRRWKVSDDSHFFPTRRIIIDYMEREVDRSLRMKRFSNNLERDEIRNIIVKNLEEFRTLNGLTLNSLSLYFRNLNKENRSFCMYDNFQDWKILKLDEEEKNKYCKRQNNTNGA